MGHNVSILINIDFVDLLGGSRLDIQSLLTANFLDDDVIRRNMGNLKFTLVVCLLHAHVENIDGTAK